ncbi:MAG: penicillin acylase family protein [Acidobacteriia bacterium]|nr:penicillin acylase family protein [Terriglobia bacterium]
MTSLRQSMLWLAALLLGCSGFLVFWYVYRPLPQIDGSLSLPGLQQSVTVDRDDWGVPHIRANSLSDLAEAQGYVVAQDRLWQMDLLRRVASGELAEIFGERALKVDRRFRILGLRRAALRDASQMDPQSRLLLESYARGVNHFIDTHRNNLPLEFTLLRYKPRPWEPADTLVITGYMYQTLTSTWEAELSRANVTDKIGPERARELFSQQSDLDFPVVGAVPRGSSDDSEDNDDEDEMVPDTILKARLSTSPLPPVPPSLTTLPEMLWPSVHSWLQGTNEDIHRGFGSNNWVVSGAHTASGKPLLSNDTHLELSVPSIWYQMHLTAPGWNVKGFTFPGAPLVIIGHNDRIAWGFTNNGADVQDLYIETLNPAKPDEYLVNGQWRQMQIEKELIVVRNHPAEIFSVGITRHGPIVLREHQKAWSLRWTALEPGALLHSYLWLGRARNWDEFRNEMKLVWGPAQNAVYADVDGNIGYLMAARVPIRKKGRGEVPVPGDSDDYEWTGYIPFEQLPQLFNPEDGLIATANARVVGPKYKPYLTDRWEAPYRTARIHDLLAGKIGLRPADMLAVQTDVFSYPHLFLARQLLASAKIAQPSDPRAREMLLRLKDWDGAASADRPETAFLEAARREASNLLLEPFIGDDARFYQGETFKSYLWRSPIFLQKILTERPARWLPKSFQNYDQFLAAAADKAVARLERESGSGSIRSWPWKRFNSLEMLHPLGREGLLRWLLSAPAKPQNGTHFSIRAANVNTGPSMRFTADLSNWDNSLMLLPGGQSGQPGSSHYLDQFPYWLDGRPISSPFSDAAESRARRHTLTLQP